MFHWILTFNLVCHFLCLSTIKINFALCSLRLFNIIMISKWVHILILIRVLHVLLLLLLFIELINLLLWLIYTFWIAFTASYWSLAMYSKTSSDILSSSLIAVIAFRSFGSGTNTFSCICTYISLSSWIISLRLIIRVISTASYTAAKIITKTGIVSTGATFSKTLSFGSTSCVYITGRLFNILDISCKLVIFFTHDSVFILFLNYCSLAL